MSHHPPGPNDRLLGLTFAREYGLGDNLQRQLGHRVGHVERHAAAPAIEHRADNIPRYAYFPFGGGPRVCIGNTFATLEMILLMVTILQRYRMKLADGQGHVQPEPLISIRPPGGLRVSLSRRAEPAYSPQSVPP